MNYLECLKDAIKEVIGSLSSEKEELKGKIVSGNGRKNYTYKLTGFTTFETRIVELLTIKLLKKYNDDNFRVGWEVAYPTKAWGRSRLDLALDFIEGSEYLFRIAVEVKKISSKEVCDEMVPYNVWNDIFKIAGYRDENEEFKDTGRDKFVLVFFEKPDNVPEEKLKEIFENAFVTHCYLNKYFEDNKPDLKDNIYKHFLEELGWKSCIDEALKYLGLEDGDKKKKFVEIENIDNRQLYLKDKLGAVLLRVKTVT